MDNEFVVVLRKLLQIFADTNIPFHVTGGLAASFYGEPRFTQDIDLVLQIATTDKADELIQELKSFFIIDEQGAAKALNDGGMFQALHEEFILKVDFHVGERIPGELTRSNEREIAPKIVVPIVSLEDAILSKLDWMKRGSAKSFSDVVAILRSNRNIDVDELDSWARKLNLSEQLSAARKEAGAR